MNPKNPIVLLLEDCPVTALLVERAVMKELPEVRLLWARTVAEAVARAEDLTIDLFLVDITLPDGSGLDFLWKMTPLHPDARAMVMTATPLPEYEAHSAALGALNFFEKPLKLPIFLGHLRRALTSTPGTGDEADFSATLSNVTPVDVLQLKCLTSASTVIEVHSAGMTGQIRVEAGEITDASVGAMHGFACLTAIIGWKSGRVTELPASTPGERTIFGSWQALLMEAAQLLDETHPVPA